MNFLNPIFLWALLGLLIPLAIHLWSKRKLRVIKIGSVQFLTEPETRQSSSLQLNEWWLLALRMLAIIILSLILSGPQLKISGDNTPVTYIIEPSLLRTEALQPVWDTIPKGLVRLLQPGFPEWNNNEVMGAADIISHNYWQLAKSMETLYTDSIVVYTRAMLKGLKGKRPQVDVPIQWVVINPDNGMTSVIEAQKTATEIKLLSVSSDDRQLRFDRESLPSDSDLFQITPGGDSILVSAETDSISLPLIPEQQTGVNIYYSDSLADQKEYMLAAFRAVTRFSERKVAVHISKDTDTLDISLPESIIWLSKKPLPAVQVKTLAYHPQEAGNTLIVPGPSSGLYYLTKHLDPENITQGHLTGQLIHFLDPHRALHEKINDWDRRTVSLEDINTEASPSRPSRHYTAMMDISNWLWLLLLLTLIVERIIAKFRKQ